MRSSFSFFSLLFLLIPGIFSAQTSDEKEVPIEEGKELTDSLSGKSSHSYTIVLDSAQFVFGSVNQKTVDVVVSIFNEENKQLATFDGPGRGPEYFQFETGSAGTFRIQIQPFEEKEGGYSIKISTVEPLAEEPSERVKQLMTPYSAREVPGAAVMVLKDKKIIFQEAYGMANLTYAIPFSINTPTNIGSTSKQFTAFAIQLLAEQNKLSLDDDIRKYFPELPDFGKTVTIRHLLTHTSGYREFLNTLAMTGRDLSSSLDREMLFKVIKNQPELQNEPGAEWNYNNTGYTLMAALVEKITEVPFPEWMQKNVFQPLEMNNSVVRKDQNEVIHGRSQGYNLNKDGEYQEVTDLSGAMGAGGIYTTLEDLAKWVNNFDEPKVGSAKIFKEMTTPYVLTNGDTTNYGLGLFVEEHKGLKFIHLGGADVAHRSMLMYFPEIAAAVITQSNYSNFSGNSAQKVAEAFFSDHMKEKDKKEKPTTTEAEDFEYDAEKFDPLTGRYELEEAPGFIMTFKRDGDRIYGQATGQPEVNMKAVSDSVFQLRGVNAKITFHIKEDGSADSLTCTKMGIILQNELAGNQLQKTFRNSPGNITAPK